MRYVLAIAFALPLLAQPQAEKKPEPPAAQAETKAAAAAQPEAKPEEKPAESPAPAPTVEQNVSLGGKAPVKKRDRYAADMSRTGGSWKISSITLVPV